MKEKYFTYELEDWMLNEAFVAFMEGESDELASIIEELADHPIQGPILSKAISLHKQLTNTDIKIPERTLDNIFDRINSSIDHKTAAKDQKSTLKIITKNWWIGAIAAGFALLLIFNPFKSNSIQFVSTEIGEKEDIKLPDESIVQLNAGSSLEFDQSNWDKNRSVKLNGEAFFAVEKGSSFSVYSEKGTVTVLGTQFNIYDRGDLYEVFCIEGKVEVTLQNGAKYILEAGNRLRDTSNEELKLEQDTIAEIDWLNNYAKWNNVKLKELFIALESYFDIELVNKEEYEEIRYTGFFNTSELDSALYQIFWPLDINYKRLDQKRIQLE